MLNLLKKYGNFVAGKQKEMQDKFFGFNWDFLGFMASLACALHCSMLPLLLAAGALGGLAWLEHPIVEAFFIAVSLIVASWSLINSYVHRHRNLTALVTVVLGFVLIIAGRFVEGGAEMLLTTLGGITIAMAHVINWRLVRDCEACVLVKTDK